MPRIKKWDSATDTWELYHISEDFSEAKNLAKQHPNKVAKMKQDFLKLAEDNRDFPIGAGLWLRIHPEDRITTPYTSWNFNKNTRRMPEFTAPGIGSESNRVEIDLDVPENADGVLYALGGAGGGLTLYFDEGHLNYLYNLFIIEQYTARSEKPIAPGKHKINVITEITGPGKEGTVTILVDGKEVAKAKLDRTVPMAFSASESFDVGVDLGSTVSLDYMNCRPFEFNGDIERFTVELE